MAVNFPTSLDTFTTHSSGQVITSADVNKIQDELVALQAKVGVNGSAVTSSLDYKIAHITNNKVWKTSLLIGAGAISTCWKGITFQPTNTITVQGMTAVFAGLTASSTIAGAVATVSAGAIATITTTNTYTYPAAVSSNPHEVYLPFASPLTMTGGTTYTMFIGYNSNAGGVTTTTGPLLYSTIASPYSGMYEAPAGTLTPTTISTMTTFTPAVSTAVGTSSITTGNVLIIGLVWA